MPKRVDHEARRADIRAAAVRVLAREGTLSGGLAAVAEEAGMQRAAMYHYYRDRESLLEDVATGLLAEEELAFAEALAAEGSVADRIDHLVRAIASRFDAWAELGAPLLEIWARDPQRVRALLRTLRKHLAALMTEGQDRGEITRRQSPDALATLVIAMVDGIMFQVLTDPEQTPRGHELESILSQALRQLLLQDGHDG